MGQKMSKAPVYFVIVQARFNPILALDSYAPAIQDNFRKNGFPDFQKAFLNTFNLNGPVAIGHPNVPMQVPMSQAPQYHFVNSKRTASFILGEGALSFQTTSYDVFETFSDTFLMGLGMVHEAVGLSYTDRIGVRYLDAIVPENGEDVSDYLDDCVLGLYAKTKGAVAHSFSETVYAIDSVAVTARVVIQTGGLGFPPDLDAQGLNVSERFLKVNGTHAILDNDGSITQRDDFEILKIKESIDLIHTQVTGSFRMTVTDHALKVWA